MRKVRTEPTKTEVRKWVKALRSGKYKQGYAKLCDNGKYCCLGVACHIFKSKNSIIHSDDQLPYEIKDIPEWLKNINLNFKSKTADDTGTGIDLAALNDSQEHTFDEIADILEIVYLYGATFKTHNPIDFTLIE